MKSYKLILAIALTFCLSTPAFAVELWTNVAGTITGPAFKTGVISQIVADFQTSSGVTLAADTDAEGSFYGVASGHVIAGTRIYQSHSNNSQIEFTEHQVVDLDNDALEPIATTMLEEAGAVEEENAGNLDTAPAT